MEPAKRHICIVFNQVSSIEMNERGVPISKKRPKKIDLSEVGVVETSMEIKKGLTEAGYVVSTYAVSPDIEDLIATLKRSKPNLIFNLCESLKQQAVHELHVAGIYELLDIPYTGSAPLTMGFCLLKARAKDILRSNGINTPKSVTIEHPSQLNNGIYAHLQSPLIVKPSQEDASIGIENSSVVGDTNSAKSQILKILEMYHQPALIEEFIEGRELNVAILGNVQPRVLPISEIDFSGLPNGYPEIVTYNAKWVDTSPEFAGTIGKCPADLPKETEALVKATALKAYSLMGCRDYARVDIRLTQKGIPYVLEVNPNPDISKDGGFFRSARNAGLTYPALMHEIVRVAFERSNGAAK
jgi:D-alanine-D-alanine ligase